MNQMKTSLLKMLSGITLMMLMAFSMSAKAATSVAWTSPADGSVYPVGTAVMPEGQASATGTAGTGLDLALVLDSSGSMGITQTVGGVTKTRAQWQKDAAIALVNNLPTTSVSVAVVEFDSNANLVRQLSPLLTDKAAIIAAINSVDASGGTFIGSGIQVATTELTGANHTAGRSQQMVVFSDGSTAGNPSVDAANALAAGVDSVHSVALPGAVISTMQGIASNGNGTFIDASSATGIQDLIDLFSGLGGNLVGIDRVDITMPDGTFVGSVAVDAFGNFKTPEWLIALGANTFTATAYGTDGSMATADLTLIGRDSVQVPEPGILGLLGLGLVAVFGVRRRKSH
jgi:Mg-chelatase subunit ChlD